MAKINKQHLADMHARGYLSAPEIAKVIGVTDEAVRGLIKRGSKEGSLDSLRVGRFHYVTIDSVVRHYGHGDSKNMAMIVNKIRDQLGLTIVQRPQPEQVVGAGLVVVDTGEEK